MKVVRKGSEKLEYQHKTMYDRQHSVVMSNKLIKSTETITQQEQRDSIYSASKVIQGKQTMTLQVARMIRLIVAQVAMADDDLRTYTCKINELAKFLGVPTNDMYRDIRKICANMMNSYIYLGTENPKSPWKMIHWVSTAEYDGMGTVTIKLSEELKPYVIGLSSYFTKYKLGEILSLNSYYAIRIYEIILCELGEKRYMTTDRYIDVEEISISIETLRKYLGCENKLIKMNDFYKKAIKVAVDEINEKTGIYLLTEYKKRGRKVDSIIFTVATNILYYNDIEFINDYQTRCDYKSRGIKFRSTTDEDIIKAKEEKRAKGL